MKITRHYCPDLTDEYFQILSDPGDTTLSINRLKGADYLIEIFDGSGQMIISCNYPSYMHSKLFDLSPYGSGEFILRMSGTDGSGVCLYRITT